MICVLEGDLPGFGPVYFNPNRIANILSLAVVEARGRRMTYDSWLGGRFKVHNPDSGKIIDFCQLPSGLYAHDTEAEKMPDAHTFVETVEENKKVFTARQFIKAKAARELYGMVGVPSAADFITAVRNKMIPNTKVTVDDIKTAEAIFGKDLGAIKGKTTRSRPAPVVTDQMMLPPDLMENHKTITLAADIFFVNKIPFFITVSQHISFATGDRLPNRNSGTIVSALLRVVALYSKRGFIVAICNMDNEFECIKNLLMKRRHGIQLNICAPDKHVPEIERKIRTVKERIRSVSSTLPFEALPELVVVHLVMFCLLWLNFFPPSGGISPTLSPEAIVKGRGVDSKLHCRVPFGGYVQVQTPNEPTNNALTSRTVGAIALGPTGNSQGTYKFMSLVTGRLIKGTSFTILPMPSDVQEKVKELATKQPKEMTFGDRDGKTTIHDLLVDEAEDDDDDNYDDYESAKESLKDEDEEEILHFDEGLGDGDFEVTNAITNILPDG